MEEFIMYLKVKSTVKYTVSEASTLTGYIQRGLCSSFEQQRPLHMYPVKVERVRQTEKIVQMVHIEGCPGLGCLQISLQIIKHWFSHRSQITTYRCSFSWQSFTGDFFWWLQGLEIPCHKHCLPIDINHSCLNFSFVFKPSLNIFFPFISMFHQTLIFRRWKL